MHLDFTDVRVAVIGDLIVDRYVEGAVNRLSPEAPVPVLLSHAERDVLGGAANVIANLASLGVRVDAVGAIGPDAMGRRVTEMLGALRGVETAGLIVDPDRPTTCKMRVVSGLHQIVRVDNESCQRVTGPAEDALLSAIEAAVARCDVAILSDYAKGVCSDRVLRATIEACAAAGKPCLVDPKRRDFTVYRGATIIKPNRRELAEAVGHAVDTDAEIEAAAWSLVEQTGSAILLTRSEQGMSYFTADQPALHLKTAARDVFDVSGAGDTVVAMAALGCATGRQITETMRLANVAAGLVVAKVGTTPVHADELELALDDAAHHGGLERAELTSLEGAVRQRQRWARQGLHVGFTNGCFDLIHPGHVSLLRQAAEQCDKLIVGINSDASVSALKGPSRPVNDEAARACVLGAMSAVDLVVVFGEDTPARLIEALVPDLLVKGADYTEDQVVGADVVKAAGGRVMLVPLVAGRSTTAMIARSRAGEKASETRLPETVR